MIYVNRASNEFHRLSSLDFYDTRASVVIIARLLLGYVLSGPASLGPCPYPPSSSTRTIDLLLPLLYVHFQDVGVLEKMLRVESMENQGNINIPTYQLQISPNTFLHGIYEVDIYFIKSCYSDMIYSS